MAFGIEYRAGLAALFLTCFLLSYIVTSLLSAVGLVAISSVVNALFPIWASATSATYITTDYGTRWRAFYRVMSWKVRKSLTQLWHLIRRSRVSFGAKFSLR